MTLSWKICLKMSFCEQIFLRFSFRRSSFSSSALVFTVNAQNVFFPRKVKIYAGIQINLLLRDFTPKRHIYLMYKIWCIINLHQQYTNGAHPSEMAHTNFDCEPSAHNRKILELSVRHDCYYEPFR